MRNATATNRTASANIRATHAGGLRTGLSSTRNTAPGPVTVWAGPGPTSLPHTLAGIAPVAHPEPKADPLVAKLAAAKAAAQAAELARQRRRNQRNAKAAARPVAAPVAKVGGVVSRHRSYEAACVAYAKINNTALLTPEFTVTAHTSKAYPWVIRRLRS